MVIIGPYIDIDKGGTTPQIEIVSLNELSQPTSPKQRGPKQGGFVGAH